MKTAPAFLVSLAAIMSSNPLTGSSATAESSGRATNAAFASSIPPDGKDSQVNEGMDLPQLPESDPNADIPSLKLGESMKLDHLGPVIINSDGTTRRIDNWAELTDKEKEVTWRRISKRNEERRKKLMAEMEQESQAQSSTRNEDL